MDGNVQVANLRKGEKIRIDFTYFLPEPRAEILAFSLRYYSTLHLYN